MFDIFKNGVQQNAIDSNNISNAKAIWNPFKIGSSNRAYTFAGASELEFLATIGYNDLSFNGCTKLKKLVFLENEDSTDEVFDCFDTRNINSCTNLKTVSLPDTVSTISVIGLGGRHHNLTSIRANHIEHIQDLDLLNEDGEILDVSNIDFSTVTDIGVYGNQRGIRKNWSYNWDPSYGGFDMSGFTNLERIYQRGLYMLKISALPYYNPNHPVYNQGPNLRGVVIDKAAFESAMLPAYNMIYFMDLQMWNRLKEWTFYNTNFNGTKVWLGSQITDIGYLAFKGAQNFGGIVGGSNITSIATGAFNSCEFISNATTLDLTQFPNLTSLGEGYDSYSNMNIISVFGGSNITSVIIPSTLPCSVDYLQKGFGLFEACTYLTSVTFDNGFTSIWPYMFKGCTSLQQITLPSNLTSVGQLAFANTGLTSVALPSNCTYYSNSFPSGCTVTGGSLISS